MKNQFILVTTIDFPLLVPQKSSVESSIKDKVYQKSMYVYLVYICRPQTRLAKHVLEIKALSAVSHPSLDYYIITIWLKNK